MRKRRTCHFPSLFFINTDAPLAERTDIWDTTCRPTKVANLFSTPVANSTGCSCATEATHARAGRRRWRLTLSFSILLRAIGPSFPLDGVSDFIMPWPLRLAALAASRRPSLPPRQLQGCGGALEVHVLPLREPCLDIAGDHSSFFLKLASLLVGHLGYGFVKTVRATVADDSLQLRVGSGARARAPPALLIYESHWRLLGRLILYLQAELESAFVVQRQGLERLLDDRLRRVRYFVQAALQPGREDAVVRTLLPARQVRRTRSKLVQQIEDPCFAFLIATALVCDVVRGLATKLLDERDAPASTGNVQRRVAVVVSHVDVGCVPKQGSHELADVEGAAVVEQRVPALIGGVQLV
eukprot:scaffold433_cov257-Pinguiococcus_pyrenoidosus.AAC.32